MTSYADTLKNCCAIKLGAIRQAATKCASCMVHSGYEASAVDDTFGSLSGLRHRPRHII
jgi:hypothetical protein